MTHKSYKSIALAGLISLLGLLATEPARADNAPRQLADGAYAPNITDPRYAPETGPRVCSDEGHHEFHKIGARFAAFAATLRADGYRVMAITDPLSAAALRKCDLLVVANAQPSEAPWETYPHPTPSAFSPQEVAAARAWVKRGGAIMLVADHMPLAGAAASLAEAMGFHFQDGFALPRPASADALIVPHMPDLFRAGDGTLRRHPITDGSLGGAPVTQVATFIGQAFRAEPDAEPLLVLPDNFIFLTPDKPWEFKPDTPRVDAGGWLQGAVRRVGRGRVAAFGEAAMFTSQIASNGQPMGLAAPGAEQNARFLRNVIAWLTTGPSPAPKAPEPKPRTPGA